ncbi:MAG: hypothetical protein ACYC27_18430 [Armatimonadota bacterium]
MSRSKLFILISVSIVVIISIAFRSVRSDAASRIMTDTEVKKIIDAPSRYSFTAEGTTRFRYKGKMLSTKIRQYHKKPDKCRIEYLSSPLTGVVVGNTGGNMWRFDPRLKKSITISTSGCHNPRYKMELFLRNHRIEENGRVNVARRDVRIVDVKTKSGQIEKRLWIDIKTYTALRTIDYDAYGKTVSSTEFTSIKYSDGIPDSLFKQQSGSTTTNCRQNTGQVMTASSLSKNVGFNIKSPRYVPSGYKIDSYRLYKCLHSCGHKSAYIRYTNGLSSVSIFESAQSMDSSRCGMCMPGHQKNMTCAINKGSRSQSVTASVDGISITIIGDIKSSELLKIAGSFK